MKNKITLTHDKNNHAIESRDMVHNVILAPTPSTRAMDLLTILVSQVHKDDEEFKEYSISKPEIEEIIGKEINYRLLDTISASLASLTRKEITKKGIKESYYPMFKRVGFDLESENKALTLELGEHAKPYFIYYGKNYLNYNPFYTFNLSTFYIKRFYKICKDKLDCHKDKPSSVKFELEIDYIKEVMNLDKYMYGDIKKRIIMKAQDEFAKHTDIAIEFAENKKGRKVVSLDITVFKTKEKPIKKPNNFKPYLQFRDSLLNIDRLDEESISYINDGIYEFKLFDEYSALIDTNKDKVLLAYQNIFLDDRRCEELGVTVDEIWQEVFSRRSEIEEKFIC